MIYPITDVSYCNPRAFEVGFSGIIGFILSIFGWTYLGPNTLSHANAVSLLHLERNYSFKNCLWTWHFNYLELRFGVAEVEFLEPIADRLIACNTDWWQYSPFNWKIITRSFESQFNIFSTWLKYQYRSRFKFNKIIIQQFN